MDIAQHTVKKALQYKKKRDAIRPDWESTRCEEKQTHPKKMIGEKVAGMAGGRAEEGAKRSRLAPTLRHSADLYGCALPTFPCLVVDDRAFHRTPSVHLCVVLLVLRPGSYPFPCALPHKFLKCPQFRLQHGQRTAPHVCVHFHWTCKLV